MNIFISGDADGAGKLVGRARLADDAEALRRLSHALDDGNELWKKWAESHGGNMVEMGGDEFCCEIPADYLDELPKIKEQYEDLVGATLSVGVGIKISESAKALLVAKLQGKNRVVFYSEDCDKIVAEAAEHRPNELEKLQDEYLNKADIPVAAGATHPSAPSVQKPVPTQGEHSEGQNMYNLLDEERPPAPEQTHAAKDFEGQLHDEAWKGEEEDAAAGAQKNTNLEQIKVQVVQALQGLKAQAPILEQMKQASPQAYQSLMGLAQAVIGMARELAPDQAQPMQKSEALDKADKPINLVHYSKKAGLKQVDTKHMGQGAPSQEYRQGLPEVQRAYYYRAGTQPEPLVTQGAKGVYSASLDPRKHRLYDIGKDPEGLRGPSHEKFLSGEGLDSPEDTFLNEVKSRGYHGYHNSASSLPGVVALFHAHPVKPMKKEEIKTEKDPHEKMPEAEDLDKAKLPMPGANAHHEVVLPSGSQVDNKVKVTHQDGKSSWKQMSAGQIRSQDPAGHATSSRSPNSK